MVNSDEVFELIMNKDNLPLDPDTIASQTDNQDEIMQKF